jgi:long-chain acyl-CoA synthetase
MPVKTLSELFQHSVVEKPRKDLFRYKSGNRWVDVSSDEFRTAVVECGQGLVSVGVQVGDRVALLSENRLEWAMVDFGILTCGAITVPIYPTLLSQQIEYILGDAKPTAVICSTAEQAAKLEGIEERVPSIRNVISIEPVDRAELMRFSKLRELGAVHHRNHPDDHDRRRDSRAADDVATIVYTSGTTGNPKGVMLTHQNIVSNVLSALQVLHIDEKDSCLSFLPLSHILERMAGQFLMVYCGVSIAHAESIEAVAANMTEIQPTIVIGVPRFYEKIYARVQDAANAGGAMKQKIFRWAKATGDEYVQQKVAGRNLSAGLRLRHKAADALVFKKLRARTGGRLRFFVSGSAPLAKEIAEFFYAAGLTILEGYGLTETSPLISVNTFEAYRPGSVGRPAPGIEVRIAEDGEILTRSSSVMKGYYELPFETSEAIRDGWFATGDTGHLDEDGFLFITDRKKDLLVTAGGKNVAPQPMENALKLNEYITEAVVLGDKRKYLTVLLVPSFENLEEYARHREIPHADLETLLASEPIQSLFQHALDQLNANLPRFQQIKYFRLVDREFTLEAGELTPSLKVKRKAVNQKFAELIETMYGE